MVSAKVILDSISDGGIRLATVEAKFHRFVLAELNTHRAFSRNSASSRAIPVEKQIERVLTDPAIPLHWGKNQAGMKANEQLDSFAISQAKSVWLDARMDAALSVRKLNEIGLHKQVANRILEPFLWHTAIISATEWDNFFDQRDHPDAQPEMRALAVAIRSALAKSVPSPVGAGEWHLPYIMPEERLDLTLNELKKVSVARCARVSYLTHDGIRDISKDLDLFDKLSSARPAHASPLEHVARPRVAVGSSVGDLYHDIVRQSNFDGWIQFRHEAGL